MNYSKVLNNVPQTSPILGMSMVKNNAGGYVFSVKDTELLARFLFLGSESNTYYVDNKTLTLQSAQNVLELIKKDSVYVAKTALTFLKEGRVVKVDPSLFVLALVSAYGNKEAKSIVYSSIKTFCKTFTHLSLFLANVHELRGWSSGLRKGVASWYNSKTPEQLTYQVIKYRNRNGFTHKDVLRLAHPKALSQEMNDLFKYIVGKTDAPNVRLKAFEQVQKGENLYDNIREYDLPWEAVPTEKLNEKETLKALLDCMPLTALIRNLNRFAYNDLTVGLNDTTKKIVQKLTDEESVRRANIHPLNVVNYMLTYNSGKGNLGNKNWNVNQNIVDSLNDVYELSVKTTNSTNKNILIAVDKSGSMHHPVKNMAMTAAQIANVLGVSILKTEPNAEMIWFDTEFSTPSVGRRNSVLEVLKKIPNGGGTDCSCAFRYAIATGVKYDAIIILTDSETWAGQTHGVSFLASYKAKVNKDVKVVEIAMVQNPYSSLPDDKNLLRVVGFDTSVLDLVGKFIEGR